MVEKVKILDSKKPVTFSGTFFRRLKEASGIYNSFLFNFWKNCIIQDKLFPDKLKFTDVTPIFLKNELLLLKLFRRYSRGLFKISYWPFFPPLFCGYGNSFSSQTALQCPLEKWKAA